eukprot:RCo029416
MTCGTSPSRRPSPRPSSTRAGTRTTAPTAAPPPLRQHHRSRWAPPAPPRLPPAALGCCPCSRGSPSPRPERPPPPQAPDGRQRHTPPLGQPLPRTQSLWESSRGSVSTDETAGMLASPWSDVGATVQVSPRQSESPPQNRGNFHAREIAVGLPELLAEGACFFNPPICEHHLTYRFLPHPLPPLLAHHVQPAVNSSSRVLFPLELVGLPVIPDAQCELYIVLSLPSSQHRMRTLLLCGRLQQARVNIARAYFSTSAPTPLSALFSMGSLLSFSLSCFCFSLSRCACARGRRFCGHHPLRPHITAEEGCACCSGRCGVSS